MSADISQGIDTDIKSDWTAEDPQDMQYGCVFCRTGQERFVAYALSEKYEGVEATAVTQIKHKSLNGTKSTEEHILLPGYVFFRTRDQAPPFYDIHYIHGVIRLLRGASGQWWLLDDDCRFAHWVFDNGGQIGLSKAAYSVGDKVRILSGPLKDYEGNLIKIDRRSRNGQIEIRFDERVWRIWLAFEFVDLDVIQEKTLSAV